MIYHFGVAAGIEKDEEDISVGPQSRFHNSVEEVEHLFLSTLSTVA